MLGGEVDTSRYQGTQETTRRTSLTLSEKDREYLREHGDTMADTARQVIKFLRENNISPTELRATRCDA